MKIPNNFYFYWTGNKRFYFPYLFSIKSIQKIENPDKITVYYNDPIPNDEIWYYLGNNMNVDFKEFNIDEFRFDFIPDSFYDKFKKFIDVPENRYRNYNISDIARCLILYKYGGIYYDFDTVTIKSVQPLIQSCNAFIPTCSTRTIIVDDEESFFPNGNLGSCANSNFFHEVIKELNVLMDKNCSSGPSKIGFGPEVMLRAYKKCQDIEILKWQIFHAIGHKGKAIEKVGFFYGDIYQKMCKLSDEAHVLHFHTGKTQSSRSMECYNQPYNIRRKKDVCSFASWILPFIDEEMNSYDWGHGPNYTGPDFYGNPC